MAGDAMIAVSLAGTLFFAATTDAQRSNVALYLLVTMAPFAVLAPGHRAALDRLQRGRRWALAASLARPRGPGAGHGRATSTTCWLYPAALGVLVLSKAHNVLRAAVVPRVLPPAMSLTSANARLSVFGLVDGRASPAASARASRPCSGFDRELGATAAVFVASPGCWRVRLPRHVDVPTGELPADVLTTAEIPVGSGRRRRRSARTWCSRCGPTRRCAASAASSRSSPPSWCRPTFADGWAADPGARRGRRRRGRWAASPAPRPAPGCTAPTPDRLVLVAAAAAAAVTVLAAVFYSFAMAAVVAGVAAVTNALGKVSLDAIIQREVPEQPAGLGVRPLGDRGCRWPGSSAARSASPCRRPAGSASPSPRPCSVLAVGAGALEPAPRRPPPPPPVAPEAPTDPGGTAVVVSGRVVRPAAARRPRRLRQRGRAGPATCGSRSAPQDVTVRPVQYCLDGERPRYDDAPPIIEVSPDAASP